MFAFRRSATLAQASKKVLQTTAKPLAGLRVEYREIVVVAVELLLLAAVELFVGVSLARYPRCWLSELELAKSYASEDKVRDRSRLVKGIYS